MGSGLKTSVWEERIRGRNKITINPQLFLFEPGLVKILFSQLVSSQTC